MKSDDDENEDFIFEEVSEYENEPILSLEVIFTNFIRNIEHLRSSLKSGL